MSLNAKDFKGNGGGAPALDAGAYPARLVLVVGLGLQEQRPYKGDPKPPQYEMQTVYECTDEFLQDEEGNDREDKPRWLWEDFPIYGLGSERAKSTARYYALDPEEEAGGDWSQLAGRPVLVTITKDKGKGKNEGKEYNNVSSTSTMRAKEAAKLPDPVNEVLVFDPDEPDMEVWAKLPDSIQKKIRNGLEYEGSELSKLVSGQPVKKKEEKLDDEIPFDGEEEKEDW